jgi:hypothetical protein
MLGIASLFFNQKRNVDLNRINNLLYYKTLNKNLSSIFWFYNIIKTELDKQEYDYDIYLSYDYTSHALSDIFGILNHQTNAKIPFNYFEYKSSTYNGDLYFEIMHYYPRLTVVIHYPELKVTNKLNRSIHITDMYVQFHITQQGDIHNKGLLGRRGSFTELQLEKNYSHSHLPSSATVGFTNFCLGSGTDITMSMMMLYEQILNKNKEEIPNVFNLFLLNLKAYLQYESLEGGPYIKMSYLTDNTVVKSSVIELFNLTKYITRSFDNKYLYLLIDGLVKENAIFLINDELVFKDDYFEKLLVSLLIVNNFSFSSYPFSFIIYSNGEVINKLGSVDLKYKIENKYVLFKKTRIPLTITNASLTDNFEVKITKPALCYIYNKLNENHYYNKILNYLANEKYKKAEIVRF